LRTWYQQVTIGDEGNEQKVQLTGKSREEIEALRKAIETAVITHEIFTDVRDSSPLHETANVLRAQAQKDNGRANMLLFEHGIRLRGFILPDRSIGHAR